MRTEKLPDGRWRVWASVQVKGERVRKMFTEPRKADALCMARQWVEQQNRPRSEHTVSEVVADYLAQRAAVLSPSTLRGYESLYARHLSDIGLTLEEFDSREAQLMISGWSRDLSPKTVSNIWNLLSGAVRVADPGHVFNVRLPREKKPELFCPDDSVMVQLFAAIRGTRLEIPVQLAAFIPARRSEICALLGEDVKDRVVTIRKAMVRDEAGRWIVKNQPKTSAGYRQVKIPEETAALLPKAGPVTDMNPDLISHAFGIALQKAGLPAFRFHDLRHYGASILLSMGIPVKEVQRRGGWDSVEVLQRIYAHALRDQIEAADERSAAHFADLLKRAESGQTICPKFAQKIAEVKQTHQK